MKEWPAVLWVVFGALIGFILGILGFLFLKYIILKSSFKIENNFLIILNTYYS